MKRRRVPPVARPQAQSSQQSVVATLIEPDQNAVTDELKQVLNSFQSAMQQWGVGGFGNYGPSAQISEPGTVFHNIRWWLVSNLRQALSEAYAEIGLISNVVNVPVEDAVRGGLNIQTKHLTETEIAELVSFMDEKDDVENLSRASKWMRLFGGGANLILTDQDPTTPLNMEAIGPDDNVEFRPVDMWELFYSMLNVDDAFNDETLLEHTKYFDYYGERIHYSRVLIQKGIEAPSFIRPRLRGWGLSVIESLISSINQYLKAAGLTYEVLDEFKLDIYKVKNLSSASLALGGMQDVKKNIDLVNWMKNFQNAIVLDSNDEYDHKQLSFAGLAEAQAGIRMQVSSDMRIPQTKLFGQSAAGFNTGEDDIEVYNGMVESSVRNKIKRPAHRMVQIRCQQLFGFVPDDLKVTFQPLRVLSSVDMENVKTQKFARAIQARQAGLISAKNFADTANRAELFDVKIDVMDEDAGLLSGTEEDEETIDFGDDEDGDEEDIEMGEKLKTKKKLKLVGNDPGYEAGITVSTKKKPSKLTVMPKRYTVMEKMRRSVTNSTRFDLEEYKALGGDNWIHPARRPFFEEPQGVDSSLWSRAKEESKKALGAERWQYVVFIYKKLGGNFFGLPTN